METSEFEKSALKSWNCKIVSFSASKETEAERKKREREEKRLQRQQELAQKREARKGGAMKLGAKKLAADWSSFVYLCMYNLWL